MENEPDELYSDECVQNTTGLLWEAVKEGRENDVRLLLPEDCDINGKDHKDCTLLSTAVALGFTTIVNLLLDKDGIDLNSKNGDGDTPLTEAAAKGHEAIVSLLLEKGDIELNPRDMADYTPLSAAAANGHEVIVSLLLKKHGIELNPRSSDGRTPLSLALVGGHEAVAALLLNQDDIDLGPDCSMGPGYALLSIALDAGLQNIASKILLAKISHNPEIPAGRSPLSWAAEKNRMDQMKLLLSITTLDPNQHDSGGRTPLSRAAEKNSISAVNLLLEYSGVNVDCKDQDGSTPLSRAVENQHNIVVFFLAHRDTVTLHSLVQKGSLSRIEILLDNGYDINTKDIQGQTSLHIAILSHHFEIADKLLSRGADVNSEDEHSTNPLSLAVQLRLRDFANLLLENFASMRGIKVESWRELYEVAFLPHFSLHISERATGARRVDFFGVNDMLPSGSDIRRQLFLSPTYEAWSLNMLAFQGVERPSFTDFIRHRANYTLPLEDTKRIIADHQYDSQKSRAYAIAPLPTLRVGSGESQITWQGFGVAWTCVDLGGDIESTHTTKGYQYFSMLQDGWIPDNGNELFERFLVHLTIKWSELCSRFEDYLSRLRLNQLESKGERPEMISRFAENASHIAKLRGSLQGQVRDAKMLSTQLNRGYGASRERRTLEETRKFADVDRQLQSLDQTIRDLLQMEFAWVSINEAHKSTSLATSMKRLSWITFIFLPAMFAAYWSLFGMNVDILEDNPDWRWYLLFVGSILLLTITGWLFSKYFEVERWVEAHLGRRLQMLAGETKRAGGRTSNVLDTIESSHY